MVRNRSFGSRLADIIIYAALTILLIICLYPLINILTISLSTNAFASANPTAIWPAELTFDSYEEILRDDQFWRSFGISVLRVVIGLGINMVLCILAAYPLSKSKRQFRFRNAYMNLFVFCMIFNGGLIPTYMVVSTLELTETIWALVLPNAVQVFSCILLMHFFRSLPDALEEAASIDGASQTMILLKIILPVSTPSLATIALFSIVMHWNDYFMALIYINQTANYPLQTYIQQLTVANFSEITDPRQMEMMANLSSQTLNAAKIVVTSIPILVIYPFLQKYFVHGIMIGSVKE